MSADLQKMPGEASHIAGRGSRIGRRCRRAEDFRVGGRDVQKALDYFQATLLRYSGINLDGLPCHPALRRVAAILFI